MADEQAPKPQKKKGGAKGSPQEEKKVKTEYGEDFKHLVRLSATDLPGTKKVVIALAGVKGVGIRLAPLVADAAEVPRDIKIGTITDEQVETLQEILDNIADEAPAWMRNRQKDIDSGEDLHLIGQDVGIVVKDDINQMKKIRSYRGVRHENGLPVRGQRTRANGRTGMTVGVQRKKE